MCRKNGFRQSVHCNEKSCKSMDSKLTKYNCIVKINGLRNLHTKHSPAAVSDCRGVSSAGSGSSAVVHLRRSRSDRNRMASEGINIKAKSKIRGGHDSNLRDLGNQTPSGSLNNNNEDTSSSTITVSSEDCVEVIGDKSNHDLCNTLQEPVLNCDNNYNTRHSGNNPSKVFHLKDVDNVKEKLTSNGHRISLRRVHQNLHQNGVSVVHPSSKQNGCCVNQFRGSQRGSKQSGPTSQVPKAANTSSSSSLTSDSPILLGCNGTVPHIHPEPRVVLGRIALSCSGSATSTTPTLGSVVKSLSSLSSTTLTRSSSSSSLPITSHLSNSGFVQRSQSTSSSLFLLSQDNSCSSTSSLVSTSSQEGTVSTVQDEKARKLTTCQWSKCNQELEPSRLMDHLQTSHVESQEGESFVCLWDGCKVYNKASCSKKWLDRHILCHSGDKPFPCIFDGCGQQFTSQYGLERHVNSHFNTCRPNNKQPARSKEDTPSKLSKKKKPKRKRTLPAKTDDFFDPRIMEGVHQRLLHLSQLTQMDICASGNHITFHSTVIARRTDAFGQVQVLQRWSPNNILSDSWVPESQAHKTKVLPMSDLPRDKLVNLDCSLYMPHRYRKHRRK